MLRTISFSRQNLLLFMICFTISNSVFSASIAFAERVSYPVARFSGLDKITGRISSFDVAIGETYQFGALQVTPRICFAGSIDEAAQMDGFIEVSEVTLGQKIKRIFTGWMFSESPGLNAVEHPIYDIWLKNCQPISPNNNG